MRAFIISVGAVLLFAGCSSNSEVVQKGPFDLNKRHIVEYSKDVKKGEERYYYRPDHSWSYRLDANNAFINTIASSSIITCQENDIWFISMNHREEEGKIRYRYMISLAKSQLDDMKEDPQYIPRRDSQEFQDLIKIDTELAKRGLIGCQSQMPKDEAKRVVPQATKM